MPLFSWRGGKDKDGQSSSARSEKPTSPSGSAPAPRGGPIPSTITRLSHANNDKDATSSSPLSSPTAFPHLSHMFSQTNKDSSFSKLPVLQSPTAGHMDGHAWDRYASGEITGVVQEARHRTNFHSSPPASPQSIPHRQAPDHKGGTCPSALSRRCVEQLDHATTAHAAPAGDPADVTSPARRTGRSSLEAPRVDIASSSLFAPAQACMQASTTRGRRFSIGNVDEDVVKAMAQYAAAPLDKFRTKNDDAMRSSSVGWAGRDTALDAHAPSGSHLSNQTLTALRNSVYASGFTSESRDFSLLALGTGSENESPSPSYRSSMEGPTRMGEASGSRISISCMATLAAANAMAVANAQLGGAGAGARAYNSECCSRRSLDEAVRVRKSLDSSPGTSQSASSPSRQQPSGAAGGGDNAIMAAIASAEALDKVGIRGSSPKAGRPYSESPRKTDQQGPGQQPFMTTLMEEVLPLEPTPVATGTERRTSTVAHLVVPKPKLDPVRLLGCQLCEEHTAVLTGYSVGDVIGEGGFCQVRIAVHHVSQRKVAIKIVDKEKLTDPNEAKRMQREIRVMQHLSSNECVIKLLEVVESPRLLYLVMEHAPGGSLLDFVRGCKRLSERDASYALQQIVHGLMYSHKREVVHRDIKLENILLDASNHMKLIDFGLSAFYIPNKVLKVHCGSPSYAAPEIVARKLYEGPPVDVWSTGIVLFAMLCGFLPFYGAGGNKLDLSQKIMDGKYTAPDHLSAQAKDLLQRMLTVDPVERIRLDEILQHPWLRSGPAWESMGATVYMVNANTETGVVQADEQLLQELELAGYARGTVLQYLLAGESNYITASYYLLAEGKAEVLRRMRGNTGARRHVYRAGNA